MRCYGLIITDGMTAAIGLSNLIGKSKQKKSGNLILAQNCFGYNDNVAIDFDLQFIADEEIPHKEITLYNINRYWYGKLGNKELKGKKIVLYAGTKLTPTLTRQNAYNSKYKSCYIYNDFQMISEPIFSGYIENVYTEVEGGTTAMTFTVGNEPHENSKVSISTFIGSTLTIKSGMVWFPLVRAWIIKHYLKRLSLPPIVKKGTITNTTTQSEINIDNIKSIESTKHSLSLQSILKDNFNCDLIVSSNGTIIIQDAEGKKEKSSEAVIQEKLSKNIIYDNELLTQPTIVDINEDNRIMITLPLTNRFNLDKNNYFTLLTSSSTIFNRILTVGDTVAKKSINKNEIDKYWGGTYKVQQVWHTGSSRNSDINAWTTKVEGLAHGDNIIGNVKELIKKIYKKSWLN